MTKDYIYMLLLLCVPFVSSLMIVINIYNGDILGIKENKEYMLWYIPLLTYILFLLVTKKEQFKNIIPEFSIAFFGISLNIYWIYAWEYDKKTNFRHRTEYYDTQCLLCAMTYFVLLHKINTEKTKTIRTTIV